MNHQTQSGRCRSSRCGLCLGFGGHRLLGPCPACQPADFAAYLATLRTTTSHREEDRP